MNRYLLSVVFVVCTFSAVGWGADKPIFSGPQVGEKLASFKVKGVYDDDAGKELDYLKKADGKPVLLVFVSEAMLSYYLRSVFLKYFLQPARSFLA